MSRELAGSSLGAKVPRLNLSEYQISFLHHTANIKVKQPCETALSPVKGTAPLIYALSHS